MNLTFIIRFLITVSFDQVLMKKSLKIEIISKLSKLVLMVFKKKLFEVFKSF